VQDNTGQNYTLNGSELTRDEHFDGTTKTIGHDTGEWSIKIDVEKKNGVISTGDWIVENCAIVKENIIFR